MQEVLTASAVELSALQRFLQAVPMAEVLNEELCTSCNQQGANSGEASTFAIIFTVNSIRKYGLALPAEV